MLDRERFKLASARAIEENEGGFLGIGRLSEKAMHRTLKLYYEPNTDFHEVEFEGSIADVKNGWGITEIQRSKLAYMIPKLERFLPHCPVRVVLPIVAKKRVRWLDRKTGEISESGRTVQGKRVQDLAFEIYKLRDYFGRDGFELDILLLDCDKYRSLDGWDETRKRGATKLETIPRELIDGLLLTDRESCLCLLPDTVGEAFTEREFRTAVKSRSKYSYYTLRLLVELSLLTREKQGRKYVYKRIT